eukprot:1929702-Rhodomonas_salina.1
MRRFRASWGGTRVGKTPRWDARYPDLACICYAKCTGCTEIGCGVGWRCAVCGSEIGHGGTEIRVWCGVCGTEIGSGVRVWCGIGMCGTEIEYGAARRAVRASIRSSS